MTRRTWRTHSNGKGSHAQEILAGLVLAVAVFAVVVALQPSEYRVVAHGHGRGAAAGRVRAGERLPQLGGWSPWAKLDPAAKATFEGPAAGQGAVFNWTGNDKIGEGRMTLTESRPADWSASRSIS